MKNTIKIIDLLVKIANDEEVPKQIKCNGHTYRFDETRNDYESEVTKDWTFFYNRIGKCSNMIDCLNDEIEIIEEVEEPKLDKWGNPAIEELKNKKLSLEDIQRYLSIVVETQNEIIDYLLKKEE